MTEEKVLELIKKEEIEDMEIKELFYDVFYKAVFGREQDILLKKLKIILDIKERYDNPITMIGYEIPITRKDSKVNRCDILIELSDDTYIHIEMNKGKDDNILSRNIIQVSRIYGNLRKSGKKDRELENLRIQQINLNNFKGISGKAIEHIMLCEKESGKIASEILSFCNVDVEKCYKKIYNKDIKDISKAERWGAILKAKSIKELSYMLGGDMLSMEEKERFLKTVREVNSDDRILQDWMIEENARMAYEGEMSTARRDGRIEGMIEGIKEGKKKGIAQGIKQGINENKTEVIINMLKKDIDYYTISDVTGKTIEEIKEIENSKK